MKSKSLTVAAVIAALLASVSQASNAMPPSKPTRGTQVEPNNAMGGAKLDVAVSRLGERGGATRSLGGIPSFGLKDYIEVCFTATADGYVTVWNDDLVNVPDKIFPNPYSGHATRAQPVTAGEEVCVGNDERFRLKIAEPLGTARINVIWTKNVEDQPAEDEYAMTRSSGRKTAAAARSLNDKTYVSRSLDYSIVKQED